ncbi:MAG TPA: 2-C-methyl-D-erythritol 4-phosphate cytidylyltransferase [Candidatus Competibacteraceae bacterium]|nr:2-C-methyl-D-erythritol 4-phosphate cytidylyltransferase [Candidatus Competibacteraceae bacterium]
MSRPRHWAVVPAAGVGKRMQAARPKQYLRLAGRTVIEHTLHTLLAHPRIAGVVVAVAADDPYWPAQRLAAGKPLLTAPGGTERCHSVANALARLAGLAAADDWVLVHDAARPCLRHEDLDRLLDTLADDAVGGLLAVPVRDTLKQADAAERVTATVDRSRLWHALTPQMFRYGLLRRALDSALAAGILVTDEAAAVEALGLAPRLVEGRADNLKITRPEDLALAEFFMAKADPDERNESTMRIGHGFDVHAFGPGEFITLGGVRIPHAQGLLAHSDGDVLIHALCDALLGAAALGDIGRHFPDSDATYQGADSRVLLRHVVTLLEGKRLRVGNVDATIIAQAPKMAPHVEAMRANLADDLRVELGAVNVKATTTERLGYIGRGEGIAVHAVALLLPS